MATATARETYIDYGESLDLAQVLGQGGGVKSGQTITNLFYGSATTLDNQTAHAGGGQGSATPIPAVPLVRFSVVATLGDSAILPLSVQGYEILVINDGAANMNVFPAVGESINALAVNTALAVVPATPTIFACVTKGVWHTK